MENNRIILSPVLVWPLVFEVKHLTTKTGQWWDSVCVAPLTESVFRGEITPSQRSLLPGQKFDEPAS